MASQNPTDRASRHPKVVSEPIRPHPTFPPRRNDPLFHLDRGASWSVMRPRRPIHQPGVALNVPAGNPTMRTLTRNPHRFGDMRNRHPLHAYPLHNQTTTMNREPSITVTHEDLPVGVTAITTPLGGLHSSKTVTNVPAEHI
jgi:hypothetical protein